VNCRYRATGVLMDSGFSARTYTAARAQFQPPFFFELPEGWADCVLMHLKAAREIRKAWHALARPQVAAQDS
jgi:hypothetical protein